MEALVSASQGPMVRLLQQLHSLASPPDGVNQVEIQHLIELLEEISAFLKDLSEAEDPSLTTKCWMKGARELCYDTEDFLDDFAANTDDVKADLKILKARAEDVIERLERYKIDPSSFRKVLTIGRRLAAVDEVLIDYGPIDLKLENSLDIRKESQLKVVSLVGPEGIGKTTLATKFYNKHRCNFHCCAFVRVSRKPDIMMLLTSLFTQIHQKQPSCSFTVQDLVKNIAEHLRNKRYFILFDDLWSTSVWHIISRALPVGECCSRIMTTTQIEDVALACCSYQSKYILKMEPLDDIQSMKLFFNRAFGSEDLCPPDLKEVSYEIIRKCGGLALSTVNITSLLASEPKLIMEQWEHISDSLPSTLMGNPTLEGIKEVVKFVYNNLSPDLKTCLLYLSMYPAGHTIFKDDLVKQWVVEDFASTLQMARGYFDQLVTGGMIEAVDTSDTGEVLSCTVHHIVLHLIANESMEENFIITWNCFQSTIALRDKVRRLSVQFGRAKGANISASITMPDVRSLFFFGFSDRVRSSIGDYKFLRVLALHVWAHQDKTFDLAGVSELLRLRYLKIVCNVAVKLPDEIQGQRCLEILEVFATLATIPLDIGELLKLRILRIAVMKLSSKDICSLQKLPALTSLSVHVKTAPTQEIVFDKGGFSVVEFFTFRCSAPRLLIAAHAMPNLQKLNLCFNAHEGITIEYLSCLNEISAIVGGGTIEAQRAQLRAISNDLRNPAVQLMESREGEEHGTLEEHDESASYESMEEDCDETYRIQNKGPGGFEIMEEDRDETYGIQDKGTGRFEITEEVRDETYGVQDKGPGGFEIMKEDHDEIYGTQDDESVKEEHKKVVSISINTKMEKAESTSTKTKKKSITAKTKKAKAKGKPTKAKKSSMLTTTKKGKEDSRSRIPMLSELSPRAAVQATSVGPSTLPAFEWGIATIGWIINPIIRRLLDKTFHGFISSQSMKMLQKLVTRTLPLLAVALQAADISNSGGLFQQMVTDLKTTLYDMEGILDMIEYSRHHIQLNRRQSKFAWDDDIGDINQESRSSPVWRPVRHAQRIFHGTRSTFCGLEAVTSAIQGTGVKSNRTNPGRPVKNGLRKNMHKIEVLILEAHETIERANVPIGDESCKYAPNVIVKDIWKPSTAYPIGDVIGRDEDREGIIKFLHDTEDGLDPSSSDIIIGVIGIVGIPGSGKTTLAQHICMSERYGHYFDLVMWIHVSQNFRLETMFKEIFEAASGAVCPQYTSLDVLVKELEKEISDKRFLLVLDDVWYHKGVGEQNLSQLLCPLRNGRKGSKILVTSQNADSLSDLGPDVRYTTIPISNLDDKAFFKLFMHYALGGARVDDADRRKLVMIGGEIVQKLKRSPLAARTVGRQLGLRLEVEFWRSVRDGDLLNETMRALWSHLQLDEQVARCFAYCSIFPRGYHLYQDELVKLWVAEGFIKTNVGEEMEAVGQRYFAELVATSCLHLGGQDRNGQEYYLIPDLLHELIQKVAGSDCFRIENGWTGVIPPDVRHLCIETCDAAMLKESKIFELKKLCTLIIVEVNYEEGVLKSMFKGLRKLRVLSVGIQADPQLDIIVPESIGQLKHLRYLSFGSGFSASVILPRTFTKLYHMQVLDFGHRGCVGYSSGEDMINLINLRHIISWRLLDFPNIGRLTSLQTLSSFTVTLEQGYELKQLKYLNKLRGRLCINGLANVESREEALEANLVSKERLTEMEMSWDSTVCDPEVAAEVLEGLCPPMWLETLAIVGYEGLRYPSWMVGKQKGGPKDLQELLLWRWSQLGPAPELSKSFIHLRSLWFERCSWGTLPHNMKHLKSLERLCIWECTNIRSLPTLPESLKVFQLIHCNEGFMISCQTIGDPNWQKINHIPHVGIHIKNV